MFVFVMVMVFVRDWGFSQILFITILAFSFFMKMHSYTMVNRDLAESKDKDYPANITAFNFFMYMCSPVLVYQTSYPRTAKFRLSYFAWKTVYLFMNLTFAYLLVAEHVVPVLEST
jgi:hypothetical protein